MKLIVPPLVVEENDGFRNDALGRKKFGEALTNIITQSEDELVISIDGKWGEGKTTFVRMWQGLLLEAGIPSIYIDAFKNDYIDDAFVAIASSLTAYLDAHSKNTSTRKKFKEKIAAVGTQLISWTAKVGVKAATLGAIKDSDIEALSDIKAELASGPSNLIADLIKERLSSHSKSVQLIESFREALSEAPKALEGNTSNRLVILIDELDRCKPTFSIEILEKIKHLFSVPNVVFVLVIHREQLEEAIKCIYGQHIDAHTYLQKFINVETTLPKRVDDYNNDIKKYLQRLLKLHELPEWSDSQNIAAFLEPLALHLNLSLRQLERVFMNVVVIYGALSQSSLRLTPIIVFVSVLKVIQPRLFESLRMGRASYKELKEALAISNLQEDDRSQRNLYWGMRWVQFAAMNKAEFEALSNDDPLRTFGNQELLHFSVGREQSIPFYCEILCLFRVN